MADSFRRAITGLLFILLLSADASAASVVSDYCKKNSCVETAVDVIASAFKGVEIYLSPNEINAYNCRKSDFLNLTVVSPLLSTDSEVYVNGGSVCRIKGSLLPKTDMCVFSLDGAAGDSSGYENLIVNVAVKSNAGLLSQPKELSKNFGIKMNRLASDEEKAVIAASKSAAVSIAAAYAKTNSYEDSGYNMTSAIALLNKSENGMLHGDESLEDCMFKDAAASYKNAKRTADAAVKDAAYAKDEQDGEKFSTITGKFFATASNPVIAAMAVLIALFGYKLYKEKNRKNVKMDL